MKTNTDAILDMPEDLVDSDATMDEIRAASIATKEKFEAMDRKATGREEKLFSEPCPRCGGSGNYLAPSSRGHLCFKCGGKGVLLFKYPKATREAAKQKRLERKARIEQENLDAFEAAHPELKEWWTDSTFQFAVDMRAAVIRFGDLTGPQLAASQKAAAKYKQVCQERDAARAAEKARVAAMPTLDVSHITDAFTRARDAGVKRPKLRLFSGVESFEFSRAPDNGKNPGAVYVNSNSGEYLGKVMNGKFYKGRDCSGEAEAEVLKVCSDPAQAAIAYGKHFGSCSICARELSDPISIERGIGPICADKWGF